MRKKKRKKREMRKNGRKRKKNKKRKKRKEEEEEEKGGGGGGGSKLLNVTYNFELGWVLWHYLTHSDVLISMFMLQLGLKHVEECVI